MSGTGASGYVKRNFDEVEPVACPCGEARRAITMADNDRLSIHRVSISREARRHWHRGLTEYYVVLSGEGEIEIDEERVPVRPGDVVMIPPGTRHVARGELEIINIVTPPFDPADEFED